jgi:hypothetical protein
LPPSVTSGLRLARLKRPSELRSITADQKDEQSLLSRVSPGGEPTDLRGNAFTTLGLAFLAVWHPDVGVFLNPNNAILDMADWSPPVVSN